MSQTWWSAVGLVSAWLLVWLTLQLVQRAGLMAQPNERSSHELPTPTGGGVALAVLAVVFLSVVVVPEVEVGWYWVTAITLLAAVGLWDDFADLPARLRFGAQVIATIVMVWPLAGLELGAGSSDAMSGLLGVGVWWVAAAVALVWFVNLYNFMDGIDGIAGLQCFTFCLAIQLITGGVPGWTGSLMWLLAGASLGFLSFNWPPAKIFMGDAGSLSLGLLIGGLVLLLDQQNSVSIPASLILLCVFWFDASYTLAVRFFTGQPVTQAHKSHLYQRVAARYGHFYTSFSFLILMVVWLLPLAWYAWHLDNADYIWAPWMLVALAASPLGFLCQRFEAGRVINYKLDVT